MSRPLLIALALFAGGAAAQPTVSVEPKQVILGDTPKVDVRVSGVPANAVVRSAASFGTLQALTTDGSERRFQWTPPESRAPAMGLLVFWVDEGETPPEVTVVRLPLIGRTNLEVSTEPDAEVQVVVAGKTFGPVKADGAGRAAVPIEVPPHVYDARVLGARRGKATEVTVPLGVPAYNPLMAILGPEPLYSQGTGWLWVFDASDFYTDKLTLSLRGGDARLLETTRRGTLFEITPARRARRVQAIATAKENPKATVEVVLPLIFGKPPEEKTQPPPTPPQPSPASAPSKVQSGLRLPAPSLVPGLLVGGFYSGGANLGFALSLNLALHLFGPFSAEAELGFRRSGLSTVLPGLGELTSSMIGLPLTVGGRARVLSAGPWALDLRVGVGIVPFLHTLSSSFQPTASESGVGFDGFGAAELAYEFGPVELFLGVRAGWTPTRTDRVEAQQGGLLIGFGARRATL